MIMIIVLPYIPVLVIVCLCLEKTVAAYYLKLINYESIWRHLLSDFAGLNY